MSGHFHAVVWIDHHEARVFHFSPDDVEKVVVHPERSPVRDYHRTAKGSGQRGGAKPAMTLAGTVHSPDI